jgi:hypothetical protein
LPTTGTYTIVITPCGAFGTYILSLQPATIQDIQYGTAIDSQFVGYERVKAYRFHGEVGERIVLSMSTGTLIPSIAIMQEAPNTAPLQPILISYSAYNPFWGPSTLLASGNFLLLVYSNNVAGSFQFVLERAEYKSIQYDDTVEATFTPETVGYFYQFEGFTGEVIQVNVESDDRLDTALVLIDPSGSQFAQDDDSGRERDPEILDQPLYLNGLYTLVLRPYALGSAGKIRLTLRRGTDGSLDDGPQEIQLNDKRSQATLSFKGIAGQRVRLNVSDLSHLGAGPTVIIGQEGLTIASTSSNGTEVLNFEFVVPADGTVIVQVTGSSGKFRFVLEQLGTG